MKKCSTPGCIEPPRHPPPCIVVTYDVEKNALRIERVWPST